MPPIRKGFENIQVRPMGEQLTPTQVELLAKTASKIGRHRFRDGQLIRTAYRHGLRASEIANLRRDQIDLESAEMMVRRLKKGKDMRHVLDGDEIRGMRRLWREYPRSPFVFVTERGGPMTISNIQKMVRRAGREAGFTTPIHPHQLRHACGYKLVNDGVDVRTIMDYLGHKTISQVVQYTTVNPERFRKFNWKV